MNKEDKRLEKTTCYTALSLCFSILFLLTGVILISVGAVYLSENTKTISIKSCYAMIGVGIASILGSGGCCILGLLGMAESCSKLFCWW